MRAYGVEGPCFHIHDALARFASEAIDVDSGEMGCDSLPNIARNFQCNVSYHLIWMRLYVVRPPFGLVWNVEKQAVFDRLQSQWMKS